MGVHVCVWGVRAWVGACMCVCVCGSEGKVCYIADSDTCQFEICPGSTVMSAAHNDRDSAL